MTQQVRQGDVFWAAIGRAGETAIAHPQVVVQDDLFNRSRVSTVIVCALSSKLKRASEPGNVLLDAGEANLPRASVVVVSQIESVPRSALGDYIGTLEPARVEQILDGIRFQQRGFFRPEV